MSADMSLDTDGVLRSKIIEMKRSGIEMTGFQKRLILGLCMSFECTLAKMDKISYDINGLK